jgi:hypothetical protein
VTSLSSKSANGSWATKTLALLWLAAVVATVPTPARAQLTNDEVVRALQGYICTHDYWRDYPKRQGRSFPLTVGRDGRWTVAWLENMEFFPANIEFAPRANVAPEYSYFLQLGRKYDQGVVLLVTRYTTREAKPSRIYEDDKEKPFKGTIEQVAFTEPTQCPSRTEDTPTKQRITAAILEAVRSQLRSFNRLPDDKFNARYPEEALTVVVAAFTIDDNFVEIYVPMTREVFQVALHGFQNPGDDDYVDTGDFPFGQGHRASQRLISMIQRDGRKYEIRLRD